MVSIDGDALAVNRDRTFKPELVLPLILKTLGVGPEFPITGFDSGGRACLADKICIGESQSGRAAAEARSEAKEAKEAIVQTRLLKLQSFLWSSQRRLTNTKQAQLPIEERVGDVLRDSEEVLAVCASEGTPKFLKGLRRGCG